MRKKVINIQKRKVTINTEYQEFKRFLSDTIYYTEGIVINDVKFLINSKKELYPNDIQDLDYPIHGTGILRRKFSFEEKSKVKNIQIIVDVILHDSILYMLPPLNLVRKSKIEYTPMFMN